MNEETKIKLQAYLDGELSNSEAREISELLSKDRDAQALLAELQFVKNALHENEMDLKLPETREFFWSKIEREIERKPERAVQNSSWWRPAYNRFAAALAAGCALVMVSVIAFNNENSATLPVVVEGTGDEMGAITYHSHADRMTVVYLFNRETSEVAD